MSRSLNYDFLLFQFSGNSLSLVLNMVNLFLSLRILPVMGRPRGSCMVCVAFTVLTKFQNETILKMTNREGWAWCLHGSSSFTYGATECASKGRGFQILHIFRKSPIKCLLKLKIYIYCGGQRKTYDSTHELLFATVENTNQFGNLNFICPCTKIIISIYV